MMILIVFEIELHRFFHHHFCTRLVFVIDTAYLDYA